MKNLKNLEAAEVEVFWREFYPRLYGYFYRRLPNVQDVEDLTSLCLTILLERINQSEIENPDFYLWKIASNQLQEFFRNKSKSPLSLSIIESTGEEKLQEMEKNFQKNCRRETQELVAKIRQGAEEIFTQEEQKLFFDYYENDQEKAQLAQKYQLKESALRKRISRLKQKLQTHLQNFF